MDKKTKKERSMKKITNTANYNLPEPQELWSGEVDYKPARVVLEYVWHSQDMIFVDDDKWHAKSKAEKEKIMKRQTWESVPRFVFEVGAGKDAMNNWYFSRFSLDELPNEFFQDVFKVSYKNPTQSSKHVPGGFNKGRHIKETTKTKK